MREVAAVGGGLKHPKNPPPARKGGGAGGRCIEKPEKSTSNPHLGAREVVVADASKLVKIPPSAHVWDVREVVVVADVLKTEKRPPPACVWTQGRWWSWQTHQKAKKNHLRLAFGLKGGGGNGSCTETAEKSTSGSRLDTREVVVVAKALKTAKRPTSSSRLDAREVVAVAKALRHQKITSSSHLDMSLRW